MSIKIGDRVILSLFNGTETAEDLVSPANNYWKLIGGHGVVVEDVQSFSLEDRLLVKFDTQISNLGLACHNESTNALWILRSDLSRAGQ